jgi:hypothetical protein
MTFQPIDSLLRFGHIQMVPIAFRFPSWRHPFAFLIASHCLNLHGRICMRNVRDAS